MIEGMDFTGLPGSGLIEEGLRDLSRRAETVPSLLVSIGAPRLKALGLPVEEPFPAPEHRLYLLLAQEDPNSAHSRYNALLGRLVSFERAAECAGSSIRLACASS